MRPLPGFQDNLFPRIEVIGRFYAPLVRLWGIARGSHGAGRPSGPPERQCSPFPGFQDVWCGSTDWGNRARLCASGAIAGDCARSRGGRGGEDGLPGGPGGEFRGCGGVCLVKPVALGRPGRPGRRGPPAVLYGVWGPAFPTGLMACCNARSSGSGIFDRTLSERTARWCCMWMQASGSHCRISPASSGPGLGASR